MKILNLFNMKITYTLIIMLLTFTAFAQDEEIDGPVIDPKAREKIKAAHAAYITERLELSADEAEKFWPIYREYATKRRGIKSQLPEAKKNGADEKALLDLDLQIKQQELDLERDYTGRLQKVISAQKLVNLKQAEGDFRRMVLRQIQQRQMQMERRQQMRDRSQQRLQQRNN